MQIKPWLKRVIGRTLPTDTLEKLTEYSISEREMPLVGSALVEVNGSGWDDLVGVGRFQVWKRLLERIGTTDVLLVEFGVFRGDSMRKFVELIDSPGSRFYGFDSFEGLPEVWRGTPAGHFGVSGNIPKIDDDRVSFVKGWFRDTLPRKLDELADVAEGRSIIVHFDADLYSSTLYVMFKLAEIFNRYSFIFDEFAGHEARALYNFCQAAGAEVHFHNHLLWKGWPATVSGSLELPRVDQSN